MKKQVLTCVALAIMVFAGAGSAIAQNAYFESGPTIIKNGKTLTATGTVAGLGSMQFAIIRLNAVATFSTTCTNSGGHVSEGKLKTQSAAMTGKYIADANGKVTFSITTITPTMDKCPNSKWQADLSDVIFTNLSIQVNGIDLYKE